MTLRWIRWGDKHPGIFHAVNVAVGTLGGLALAAILYFGTPL